MRKLSVIALILALVFLCGCGSVSGSAAQAPAPTPDETATVEETAAPAAKNEWSVIDGFTLAQPVKYYYDTDSFYESEYNFHIPQFVGGGELGDKLNAEIFQMFKSDTEYLETMRGKDSVSWEEESGYLDHGSVYYDCYQNGNILSLVIHAHPYYEDMVQYYVYNIDTEKNAIVSNDDLISLAGKVPEQWRKELGTALAYKSDEMMVYLFESLANQETYWDTDFNGLGISHNLISMYTDSMEMRSMSVCDLFLAKEQPVFLNGEGKLTGVSTLFVPAGSGRTVTLVTPDDIPAQQPISAEFENAGGKYTLSCDENGITLTVNGENFMVEGGFKHYTDCKLINIHDGEFTVPYAVLLCDDGTVSYIDIGRCGTYGLYYVTEPLFNCYGIDKLYDTKEENCTVINAIYNYAVNVNQYLAGEFMSFYDTIGYEGNVDGKFHLINFVDGKLYYQYSDDIYTVLAHLEGYADYLGTTGEGMVFAYDLPDDFTLFVYTPHGYLEEYDYSGCGFRWIIKPNGLDELPDSINMKISYG